MPRKKARVNGLNISDETAQNAILAHLADSVIDNAGEIVSLAGIYAISHDYWKNHEDALKQTAITFMLLKSGNSVAITAALGGIVLREFMRQTPEEQDPEGPLPPWVPWGNGEDPLI